MCCLRLTDVEHSNLFYVISFNIRVDLPITKLKDQNII